MIVTEPYGIDLIRTYSDAGYKIRQDGTGDIYDEAIDPADSGRTYTETDIPIEEEGPSADEVLEVLLGEGD